MHRHVEKLTDSVRFSKELLETAQLSRNSRKYGSIDIETDLLAKSQLRLSRAQTRLNIFSTKFYDPAYLGCANFHYLVPPRGIICPSELPPFWGLIDEYGNIVNQGVPKQVKKVTVNVLRAISRANTRDFMKICEAIDKT